MSRPISTSSSSTGCGCGWPLHPAAIASFHALGSPSHCAAEHCCQQKPGKSFMYTCFYVLQGWSFTNLCGFRRHCMRLYIVNICSALVLHKSCMDCGSLYYLYLTCVFCEWNASVTRCAKCCQWLILERAYFVYWHLWVYLHFMKCSLFCFDWCICFLFDLPG